MSQKSVKKNASRKTSTVQNLSKKSLKKVSKGRKTLGSIQKIKPKTARGKRFLDAREPKAIEGIKQAIFMRTGKTSHLASEALSDLYSLKKPHAVMMGRSNKDVHPFDDAVVVEAAAKKADAALFALASHTKKRPSTLTFGRLFDGSLLDMVEVHIVEGRSIRDIGAVPCGVGIKPAFAFLGDLWEEKEDFRMFKNILLDFYRGSELDEADLHGMETYISVTAVRGSDSSGETNGDVADHVLFRVYRINMISKPGARVPDTVLTEMGPRLDMRIGRTRPANPDVMKEALRKVRDLEPRTKKNVIKNVIGDTFGRVHVGDQKLASLQARKLKGLKPSVSEEVADLQD